MNSKVLLGFVGDNPASILITARTLKPSRVVLLCTGESHDSAKALVGQLEDSPGVAATILADEEGAPTWRENPSIEEAHATATNLLTLEELPLFDITGGTKTMLLGVWEALRARFGAAPQSYYLDRNRGLLTSDGSGVGASVVIEPAEFLAWSGTSQKSARSQGKLHEIASALRGRLRVAQPLVDLLSAKRSDYGLDENHNRLDLTNIGAQEVAKAAKGLPEFTDDGRWLVGPAEWFQRRLWLEEWCLVEAANATRTATDVRAVWSLKPTGPANQEFDVVLSRGHRLLIIEAKGRGAAGGAGDELHKRVQTTRAFFGDLASVIFVHPAWGQRGNMDLMDAVDERRVELIGSDRNAYHKAVRRFLGLGAR